MKEFDYYFGVSLGELILRHSDNLSRTLQKADISAAEGQEIATMRNRTLQSLRADENFSCFWKKVITSAETLEVGEPSLPSLRKVPKRFEIGNVQSQCYFPTTVEEHYKRLYFEAMDLITTSITERFNQPGYRISRNAEDLLLKEANGENFEAQFEFVTKFYKSDLHPQRLHQQLQIPSTNFPSSAAKARLSDVMEYFGSLPKAQRELLSEVCTIFKLLLVMPSTNAESERSFSTLRRIKTYLRSTMTQKRLNHLMIFANL